jgi:hypothetical protein
MKTNSITPLLILLAAAARLLAHEVWIEDTPNGQLVVRFAEFGDEYEKSPGSLDSLSLPAASTPGDGAKPKPLTVEKKADHFLIAGAVPGAAAHIETTFAVMGEKPARKPIFYARWQPMGTGPAKPALTFDIVPTGQPGEARVMFRGKQLAGAKVNAYLPGGEDAELTADADGLVRVAVEKPGLYLLVGKAQREAQDGFWGGRAYDTLSHNCSLAWRIPAKTP